MAMRTGFEWDEAKSEHNRVKHGLSFREAQFAFGDARRVVMKDTLHSDHEDRYYCIGRVDDRIITVRFTYRSGVIRIFGAGYWRKGKRIYEEINGLPNTRTLYK
jgi:uncharacterized DUF497 family protein